MSRVNIQYTRCHLIEVIFMPFGKDNFFYAYGHDGSIDDRYDNPHKKYVAVHARFGIDGSLEPLVLEWAETNGEIKIFPVTLVDVCKQASRKAGGAGWCFTVMINGRKKKLYLEVNKWFVEIDSK
jgi:hypothetical protein